MPRALDPDRYRTVFGHFATGVAVITVAGPAVEGGMTANAVCSVSLDPLLALVCFEQSARTLPLVRDAGRFAVNVLRDGTEDVARVFASKVPEAHKLRAVRHRLEARHADPRRRAGLARLRPARADSHRRSRDRDRRGRRDGPRRRRSAAVVPRRLSRAPTEGSRRARRRIFHRSRSVSTRGSSDAWNTQKRVEGPSPVCSPTTGASSSSTSAAGRPTRTTCTTAFAGPEWRELRFDIDPLDAARHRRDMVDMSDACRRSRSTRSGPRTTSSTSSRTRCRRSSLNFCAC